MEEKKKRGAANDGHFPGARKGVKRFG